MAKHEHGSMDISSQKKTFSGFNKAVAWSIVFIIVFLIFLAIVGG
ncbi:MAG: aa3-type cytochrome c oxidase subunit IV [Marinosulfonomonas sp.]|nr:aa3-type cytochrome c oxidase subunit IV [Marinosulfonomonas sp.]